MWDAGTKLEYTRALVCGAKKGNMKCMKLLKEWGADNYDDPLAWAASGRNLDCMKILRKWGATDAVKALEGATEGGDIECLVWAKEWAKESLTDQEFRAALKEAREWPNTVEVNELLGQ